MISVRPINHIIARSYFTHLTSRLGLKCGSRMVIGNLYNGFLLRRVHDTVGASVLITIRYAILVTAQLTTVILLAPSIIHHRYKRVVLLAC